MDKTTKFPSALISGDCTTSSLRLDGGSIIDQCIAIHVWQSPIAISKPNMKTTALVLTITIYI